jgi:hypothetical protein
MHRPMLQLYNGERAKKGGAGERPLSGKLSRALSGKHSLR